MLVARASCCHTQVLHPAICSLTAPLASITSPLGAAREPHADGHHGLVPSTLDSRFSTWSRAARTRRSAIRCAARPQATLTNQLKSLKPCTATRLSCVSCGAPNSPSDATLQVTLTPQDVFLKNTRPRFSVYLGSEPVTFDGVVSRHLRQNVPKPLPKWAEPLPQVLNQ